MVLGILSKLCVLKGSGFTLGSMRSRISVAHNLVVFCSVITQEDLFSNDYKMLRQVAKT